MGEKIFKTGIKRDNDLMYYIKGGDVWATPRKKPGQPKGKAQKVAAAGIEMDYSKYLYYLDADGDVARKERQVGGSKRKNKKSRRSAPGLARGPLGPAGLALPGRLLSSWLRPTRSDRRGRVGFGRLG